MRRTASYQKRVHAERGGDMSQIRQAKPEELPQIKELFQRCFGDSGSYIDHFYAAHARAEQVLVVEEKGEIASMATMLEMTMHLPDGEAVPVGYVYALGTSPEAQGKGYARKLLEYAGDYLREKGMQCLTLVPATQSLFRFFEGAGLQKCFATRKVEKMAADFWGLAPLGDSCKMTAISPAEYNRIREEKLRGAFHISYPEHLVEFQQYGSQMTEGDLYRIEIDGEEGCCAVELVQGESAIAKELLISPDKLHRAAQLMAETLPAARYHIRMPAFWEGLEGSFVQGFGMIKWYDEGLRRKRFACQDGYLGLAFD